jgi:hypothetical protein
MQTKMFFRTHKQMRDTEHLTLNQSLVLSQPDTLNSRSQRELISNKSQEMKVKLQKTRNTLKP